MLDSYPHVRYLPLRQRGRLWMRRTRGRTSAISRSVRSRSPLQNLRAVGRRLQNLPDRRPGKTHRTLNNSVTAAMDRVTDSGFLALKHYRPRHYGGSILFIQAEDLTGFPDNPAAVWGQFVEKLEVKTVPGSHTRMLSAHAASLGCVLSHYLAEALPCEGRQARM